jgi:translocation and assembly module TamB
VILRWLVGLVSAAILLVLLGVFVLAGTEAGTAWLVREAIALLPGRLTVNELRGNLLTGLDVAEIRYVLDATEITIRQLRIRWRTRALIERRLVFDSLEADSIAVTVRPEPGDESSAMPEIRTPLPLAIERLRLGELQLVVGDLQQTVRDIALSGALDGSQLSVYELRGVGGKLELRLDGTADLTPRLPVQANVAWRLADPALRGAGVIAGDSSVLSVAQRIHAVPEAGLFSGEIEVTAELRNPATDLHVDALVHWREFGISAETPGPVVLRDGRVDLAGNLEAWHATAASRMRIAQWPEVTWTAALDGDTRQLLIRELRLIGTPGAVAATGTVDFEAGPNVQLELSASRINPGALRPDLRGRLQAQATVTASPPANISVDLRMLEGTFMDRPVAGTGAFDFVNGELAVRDLRLRAGRNELLASGTVGDRLEAAFAVDAPELDVLWPGLDGALTGSGRLSGTPERPVGRAKVQGIGVAFETVRMESLSLTASIARNGTVAAELNALGLASGETPFGELRATASGELSDHVLAVELSGGVTALDLQSRGSWDGRTLRHTVSPASIDTAPIGAWRLRDPMPLQVRDAAVQIGEHCWVQEAATLCVREGAWSAARAALVAQLRDFSLAPVATLLGEHMTITGSVTADVAFEQNPAGITGQLSWRQDGTTLHYTGAEEPITLSFPVVRLEVSATPAVATLQAEVSGQSGIALRAAGTVADPLGRGDLAGQVSGELPDIGETVALLTPDWDLTDVAGRLTLDARVAGTWSAPRVSGALSLNRAAFALPATGVRVEDIDITAQGDDTAVLTIRGTARSSGSLALDGELALLAESGPAGHIRIRGENVDLLRLPERNIQISPDVTLRYEAERLLVEGVVTVPKAEIVVRQLPASATSPSADAVVRDRPATAPTAAGPQIGGAVQINLGDDVHLEAFGLDTRLTGGLRLSQTPEGLPAGEGVVRLADGKFGAYGKELTIERGALIFNGPLDDPAFDARASRRVDYEGKTVTVGLLLSGTAKRPASRVFSEPAMGEADALSYLVSGKPLSSASAADRSAIGGAALALGLHKASPITQQIGSAVALDELGLEGGDLDETQVVAGKQLNPDLYIRFAYGLFNRIGSVLARYRLGRGVSIEAASGEDQSLDLIWSAERD